MRENVGSGSILEYPKIVHICIYIYIYLPRLSACFSQSASRLLEFEAAMPIVTAQKLEVEKTRPSGKDLFHDHWSVTGVRLGLPSRRCATGLKSLNFRFKKQNF